MDQPLELGYVGVEVNDPAALGAYLTNVLGLMAGEPTTEGAATYRIDQKAHRLIVHSGPKDDISYAGFTAASAAAYETAADRLQTAGYPLTPGTPDEKAARRVRDLAYTTAPWGARIELAHSLADAATSFESELVPGGFVTDGLGLGHAVMLVGGGRQEQEAADRFVTGGLGMVLSDYLDVEFNGLPVHGNFYHCNGRHHSMALIFLPIPAVPKTLDHIMVETVSEDNVGHAFDRALAAGVPIVRDLGKHPNDRMFSFYSVSPAGFQFEFGTGAVLVDDNWPVVGYDKISAWGHHPRAEAAPAQATAGAGTGA
jgi:2,3-dihydroxybiphenyl 1,2-dioxygenase